jgi:uncharacterized protein YukJ
MKKTSITPKFGFMDLVKFKITDSVVAHGWILKSSHTEEGKYYRVVVTELSALGNRELCFHNGSSFGKTIVDTILEKHFGNKVFVNENDLRKDFVKVDK